MKKNSVSTSTKPKQQKTQKSDHQIQENKSNMTLSVNKAFTRKPSSNCLRQKSGRVQRSKTTYQIVQKVVLTPVLLQQSRPFQLTPSLTQLSLDCSSLSLQSAQLSLISPVSPSNNPTQFIQPNLLSSSRNKNPSKQYWQKSVKTKIIIHQPKESMLGSSILEESFLEDQEARDFDSSLGYQSFLGNTHNGLKKNCSQQDMLTFKDLSNNKCKQCQLNQVKINEQSQKIKSLEKKLHQKDKQIMSYNKSIIDLEKKNKQLIKKCRDFQRNDYPQKIQTLQKQLGAIEEQYKRLQSSVKGSAQKSPSLKTWQQQITSLSRTITLLTSQRNQLRQRLTCVPPPEPISSYFYYPSPKPSTKKTKINYFRKDRQHLEIVKGQVQKFYGQTDQTINSFTDQNHKITVTQAFDQGYQPHWTDR